MVPDHFENGFPAAISRPSVSSEDTPIGVILKNAGNEIRRGLLTGAAP